MADITIKTKASGQGRGRGPLALDAWDGVFYQDPEMDVKGSDAPCIYCGCELRDHGGSALMLRRPGAGRRTRAGLKALWCRACAAAKGTNQVVCYQAPAAVLDGARRAGLEVS